jgi:type VI secretion system secreted protein VgrG
VAGDFSQANRRLQIETPLGPDALLITALSGTEGISTLFHFQLDLLAEHAEKVAIDDLLGKPVTISVAAGGGKRFFHGVVSRLSQSGTVGRHATYRADVVPWLWFLTRTSDCRIFQKKSVPDIVKQLFGEYGFSDYRFRLTGTHEPREYCVQYRETDYNFIARVLEEEGIFYFFDHEEGKHTLVVADNPRAHQPCPVLDRLRFTHQQESLSDDDVVTWFSKEQEVRASKCSLTDYNFETPSLDLAASATGSDPRKYELYDYPACATKRDRTEALAHFRQQEEDASRVLLRGTGYARSLTPGFKCSVKGVGEDVSATFDGEYVITSVTHSAAESYAGGEESSVSYENAFECIPVSVPFRPVRRTPRPVVHGVQPAVVVGPAGEEIFVDKYGRVKVQFFWDREGKRDENSSSWLRVSQPWAGKNWGGVSIPRIGQEVIVSFMEGDPDQPIIVGRVYNGEQMPPYGLPAGGVVSGLKSQTHKGSGYNELSMDDTAGKEKITIHGQYDMNTTVEHDQTTTVHNCRTDQIDVDDTATVGNNRTVTIGANLSESVGSTRTRNVGANETVTVALTRTHSVGVNEAINVGGAQEVTVGGSRAVTVGGPQAVTIGGTLTTNVGGNVNESVGRAHTEKVGADRSAEVEGSESVKAGKTISATAGDEIVLTTGGASITMKKDGTIIIKGKAITIDAMQKIDAKAPNITSKAQAKNETTGAMVTVEASGVNTIKGSLVKIN